MKTTGWITILGGLVLTTSCSSGSGESVSQSTEALHRATDCSDLLTRVQNDAIAKLDTMVDVVLEGDGLHRGVPVRGGVGTLDRNDGAEPQSDSSVGTDGGTSGGEKSSPSSFSETNTQVTGVDEADIVKTDGQHIYLLHGASLFVLDAWPADATTVSGQVELEGSPREMFVKDGVAVVYSEMYGSPVEEDKACGDWGCAYDAYGGNYTKITTVDITGDTPKVIAARYVEGAYVSSRLHGTIARAVTRADFQAYGLFEPNVDVTNAWGERYSDQEIERQLKTWRDRTVGDIRDTELSDWLPKRYVDSGGAVAEEQVSCENYYIPAPGASDFGVTSVLAVDLEAPDAIAGSTVVLGDAEQVYANHEVMVLSQSRWAWELDGTETSMLHRFEIEGANTPYQGSGQIPGRIHDQFSIDESDGILRIATTARDKEWNTENYVVTLALEDGKLVEQGRTEPLAKGEQIYSTRFIGDIAYVVTFRQVDPLFAIDLSTPTAPRVLGELKIPGFSEYMHPLGDGHLLTIGRDGTDDGQINGLALQIFDVTDPVNPKQAHKHVYQREGWSEASDNHKAFTYHADKQLLAFPFVSYMDGFTSSLELFKVDVSAGFEQLASIGHESLLVDSCETESDGVSSWTYCPYPAEVRRGLFIDDYIYSISYGGVMVHPLSELDAPVATVSLPAPKMQGYGGASGGSVGEPAPMPVDGGGTDGEAEPVPDGE